MRLIHRELDSNCKVKVTKGSLVISHVKTLTFDSEGKGNLMFNMSKNTRIKTEYKKYINY